MAAVIGRPRAPSSTCFKFVVVGASIAGLATAYALAQAGHRVTVIEASDGKHRSRGAIRSPPNMTRILNLWGAKEELERVGVKCTAFSFHQGSDGEILGKLELDENVLTTELDAEFYFLRHGDLHTILHDLAVSAGVGFRYKTKVAKVEPSIFGVILEGGETVLADVIVGADGHESMVRPVVQNESTPGQPLDRVILTVTVPTKLMEKDSDLLPLINDAEWKFWIDSGFFAMGCATHDFQDYNLTVSIPHPQPSLFGENWNRRSSASEFKYAFANIEPRLWKILELAEYVIPTACVIRDPFENAVCERAIICLVGEAGHPMLPNGAHNAAMAIEDACTLGSLFTGVEHPDQIPRLLTAYEELRQPRWSSVQAADITRRNLLMLPRGPQQERRDGALKSSVLNVSCLSEDEDFGELQQIWRDCLDVYAFDPVDAVSDWKSKWNYGLGQRTVGLMDGIDPKEDEMDV